MFLLSFPLFCCLFNLLSSLLIFWKKYLLGLLILCLDFLKIFSSFYLNVFFSVSFHLLYFFKFYFIIFTFTYVCIHCFGHRPPFHFLLLLFFFSPAALGFKLMLARQLPLLFKKLLEMIYEFCCFFFHIEII
jgi:hypothetical protein